MSDNDHSFILQRIQELHSKDPNFFEARKLALAKSEFPTILEVRQPSGIGRGHHESYHLHIPSGHILCLLWDEDHDERLFLAASSILNLLNENGKKLVLVIGERKANLSILTTTESAKKSLAQNIPNDIDVGGDVWNIEIGLATKQGIEDCSIINDSSDKAHSYIMNLLSTRSAITQIWTNLDLREVEAISYRNQKK